MVFGLFYKAITNIYEIPSITKLSNQNIVSAIADEGHHGMGVVITGALENGFLPIRTHYNYTGFVRQEDLLLISKECMMEWEESNLMVIDHVSVDVLTLPKVQGCQIARLTKGAIVEVLEFNVCNLGWAKVNLANGQEGYVINQFLSEKKFSQSGLWKKCLPQAKIINEKKFREKLVLEAEKYLNVQYSWGGKTTLGIDCSGLTSMCYMLNGILIYRDAKIVVGFPIKEIPYCEMKMGDLLYFPGHIAMYIGKEQYIHATARTGSSRVVINSLNPKDINYREDLATSLIAVGSVF